MTPSSSTGHAQPARRRVRLQAINPRGIYALVFDKESGERRRARWLKPGIEVEVPHHREVDHLRGTPFEIWKRDPDGEPVRYPLKGNYLLPSGDLAVCYGVELVLPEESKLEGEHEISEETAPWAPGLLERIAYHEAGHAVAYMIQRISVERIVIGRGPIGGGLRHEAATYADAAPWDIVGTREHLERRIVAKLAGGMADARSRERPDWGNIPGPDEISAVTDLRTARELARRIVGDSEDAIREYMEKLARRAAELLSDPRHWRAVEEIARELMQRKEVQRPQLKRILWKALGMLR